MRTDDSEQQRVNCMVGSTILGNVNWMKVGILIAITLIIPQGGEAYGQQFVEASTDLDGVRASSVAFADVDGDDDQDLLISGIDTSHQPITKLYRNGGVGNFTEVMGVPFDGVEHSSVAFADVDGDDDVDLLLVGLTDSEPAVDTSIAKLYRNDGSGNFTEVVGTPFNGVRSGSVAFADIDNDTDLDVLIAGLSKTGESTKLYRNDGSGNFTEVTGVPFDQLWYASVAFADVDGDDDQDIILAGLNRSIVRIAKLYLNDGNGDFTEKTGTPFEGVRQGSVAFADVDNDTDQDLLITGINSSNDEIAKLYTNNGSGTFTEAVGMPFDGVRNSSVAFADVDNDGDRDVLIAGGLSPSSGTTKLYSNDGSGTFTEVIGTPFERVRDCSVAFADIDSDNDQDVVITGTNSAKQSTSNIYINDVLQDVVEDLFNEEIKLYPSPTMGTVYVELGRVYREAEVNVRTVRGQLIGQYHIVNKRKISIEINESRGIYVVEIIAAGKRSVAKVIKQ